MFSMFDTNYRIGKLQPLEHNLLVNMIKIIGLHTSEHFTTECSCLHCNVWTELIKLGIVIMEDE